ncbi:MAG: P1 family peptidase [Bacteroidales bacterium]|nr:P1 family peptidase [Bacteroidales bacterium]
MKKTASIMILFLMAGTMILSAQRVRELGIKPGVMNPGPLNAITDVSGVMVGHTTIYKLGEICTGVTAILPHDGNIFQEKVPAAVYVGNGFGKLMGTTQIEELGYLESPVVLTNTLNVPRVADAVIDYLLGLPGNEKIRSVNPVVGETNDGYLNDIRARHVKAEHVLRAIKAARGGKVDEGCVGAGTGTVCFGFKGGIGTSSRVMTGGLSAYTVGVLVQTNFGGDLKVDGYPVGEYIKNHGSKMRAEPSPDGSCMIVVATDAPLDARNLKRLAKRAIMGLARTGGIASNGSGDYVIAFSTAPGMREIYGSGALTTAGKVISNDRMSLLFQGVIEATEEAILNSLFMATEVKGFKGHTVPVIPKDKVLEMLNNRTHFVNEKGKS